MDVGKVVVEPCHVVPALRIEVLLSLTLDHLRQHEQYSSNSSSGGGGGGGRGGYARVVSHTLLEIIPHGLERINEKPSKNIGIAWC